MTITADEYAALGCIAPDCDGEADDDWLGYCSRECFVSDASPAAIEAMGLEVDE